ncbi:MAG TPA: hypothetical protein VEU30_17455 [Thermoanaerobaculia bacterium]|nr:hypothetical protein [Thermoanaerobaculia bacterium]
MSEVVNDRTELRQRETFEREVERLRPIFERLGRSVPDWEELETKREESLAREAREDEARAAARKNESFAEWLDRNLRCGYESYERVVESLRHERMRRAVPTPEAFAKRRAERWTHFIKWSAALRSKH